MWIENVDYDGEVRRNNAQHFELLTTSNIEEMTSRAICTQRIPATSYPCLRHPRPYWFLPAKKSQLRLDPQSEPNSHHHNGVALP